MQNLHGLQFKENPLKYVLENYSDTSISFVTRTLCNKNIV